MADGPLETFERYRAMLLAKRDADVKQIRVSTALSSLPADETVMAVDRERMEGARQSVAEDYLMRNAHWYAKDYPTESGDPIHVAGLLVGTAEAAAMLGVERPRIARYRNQGKLPDPVAVLAMGPVWLRTDIEAARAGIDARRKPRAVA